MGHMKFVSQITKEEFDELVSLHTNAVENSNNKLIFNSIEYNVGYIKNVLDYLESRFYEVNESDGETLDTF
jgi:hypothetical protein